MQNHASNPTPPLIMSGIHKNPSDIPLLDTNSESTHYDIIVLLLYIQVNFRLKLIIYNTYIYNSYIGPINFTEKKKERCIRFFVEILIRYQLPIQSLVTIKGCFA